MELAIYAMLRGITIGALISAPMGPIGVLCIQRTLNKGRWSGFFTGLGAAFSDLIYCLLTGLGMSFVIDFIETNQNILQIIGSVVLVIFGIYLIKKNPAGDLKTPTDQQRNTFTQDILTGFLFTFSNPLILFLIIGLFARFNFLTPEMHAIHYLTGFTFIFIGAILWWFVITFFVNAVREHFNLRSMWLVNRIIGYIILIMSLGGFVLGIKDYILNING
ncbi:MAG: LysE family transporter [Muribaculaceae bacterium]